MTQETLTEIYNLVSKYEKARWTIKRPETVMGHSVTFVYDVDNFLSYSGVNFSHNDIVMNKTATKFFSELSDVYGTDLEDSELASNIYDEVYVELQDEIEFTNSLTVEDRRYIKSIFYDTSGGSDKLRPLKTILKMYDFTKNHNAARVKLSSQYTAIIRKDMPVEVGCQRISIADVRKIIEEYDKL